MELLFYVPIGATETCNVSPSSGDLGVAGARIVVPGDPSRSVLYLRMSRRDASAMPPVATHLVDEAGAALIRDWISQMDARCQ